MVKCLCIFGIFEGSELPPKVDGKLRLYSMEYCPYVHRVRLVLRAKNIDHEIVNVNLINKPEWLFELNAEGKCFEVKAVVYFLNDVKILTLKLKKYP